MIRSFILTIGIALFAFGAPALAAVDIKNELCDGSGSISLTDSEDCKPNEQTNSINDLITNIINIFSAVVGVVAVIMIIYGGFKFITAAGDSGRISSARQTIIYAVIGLIVVALAQIFVKFVIGKARDVGTG